MWLLISVYNKNIDKITDDWVRKKLSKFKEFGVDIPFENVIYFDLTIQSLEYFVSQVS